MRDEGGFKHLCCLQNSFLFPTPFLKATEITGRCSEQVEICGETLLIHKIMCNHSCKALGLEGSL